MLENDGGRLNESRVKTIQRLIWVLEGLMNHNMTLKQLLKVSKTYQKTDQVPQGYDFPNTSPREDPKQPTDANGDETDSH